MRREGAWAYLATTDDHDLVGALDSAQSMGDENHGHASPGDHVVDGLLHQVLAFRV